ncbi:hypothetical protein DH2020_029159 [Rehmannia glutinosa]|uniref:Uncharacterized protein n=1 Tax=Rehmannia glutinosa TaxID=99300 RepID=A0ABR0VSQ5_REHGL
MSVGVFISRSAHVHGLSDSHCLGIFLNGLRDDIRVRTRSNDAADLFDTIHLAREIEREIQATREFALGAHPTAPVFHFCSWHFQFYGRAPATPQSTSQSPNDLSPVPSQPPGCSAPASRTMANSVASSGSARQARGTRQMSHTEYLDLKAKRVTHRGVDPASLLGEGEELPDPRCNN